MNRDVLVELQGAFDVLDGERRALLRDALWSLLDELVYETPDDEAAVRAHVYGSRWAEAKRVL